MAQYKTKTDELGPTRLLALNWHSISSAPLRSDSVATWPRSTVTLLSPTGKQDDRDTCVRPPQYGLLVAPPGSSLKLANGSYGLREAPRLWHLRATEVHLTAGMAYLQATQACCVLRCPITCEHLGLFSIARG